MINLFKNKAINIGGNAVEVPPIEIVRKGNSSILAYYGSFIKSERKSLNELKIIVVGGWRCW